jgi:hypothetical protein
MLKLQVLFLVGTTLVIGVRKTGGFFFQRRKLRGTLPFLGGIILVLTGWAKLGILVEGFGFINLFGSVLLQVYYYYYYSAIQSSEDH